MTAEAIGKVMRDFRRGSVQHAEHADRHLSNYLKEADVVDIQPIYEVAKRESWRLYEDSVCRPPLINAAYGWENSYGNVMLWHVASTSRDQDEQWDIASQWTSQASDHEIDWDVAFWVSHAILWMGGYSTTEQRHIQTQGPLAAVYMAINPDGVVQDYNWRIPTDNGMTESLLADAIGILARAITFMNCRNVMLLEPSGRTRAERRRIDRTGTVVQEIHITPVGAYRKRLGSKTPVPLSAAGPLSNVRGHVAKYGIEGRGKLFGKYTGEYWIPAHTRGSADEGIIRHEYEVDA